MIVPHRPLLLGHRGASAHARDNTIEAYQLAATHGADGIECDARLTSDEVVVMHHDPVVEGHGVLSGINFATLRQVHPHVPTLDETLEALPDPGFLLNIEIKNDPDEPSYDPHDRLAAVISEWVTRHDIHTRVLVSSFNRKSVDTVRAGDTAIATGLLLGHRSRFRASLPGVAADGHTWVLPHHSRLMVGPRRTVAVAHDAGLMLGTWTLDWPWLIQAAGRAWIDAIITNDPQAAGRLFV